MTGTRHKDTGIEKSSGSPVIQLIVKVDRQKHRELRSILAKHGLTVSWFIRNQIDAIVNRGDL